MAHGGTGNPLTSNHAIHAADYFLARPKKMTCPWLAISLQLENSFNNGMYLTFLPFYVKTP